MKHVGHCGLHTRMLLAFKLNEKEMEEIHAVCSGLEKRSKLLTVWMRQRDVIFQFIVESTLKMN